MRQNFNKIIESPFEPDGPVSPENFAGRKNTIGMILRYAGAASRGKVKHFFLTGDKAIGKTSLATYIKGQIEENVGMTGIYFTNRDNDSVEGLIHLICEAMTYKIHRDSGTEKIKRVFDYVESLEYRGTKLRFADSHQKGHMRDLYTNFQGFLEEFIAEINPEKGIFLIVEEIETLSNSKDFANWYRRLNDAINVYQANLKLYVLFVGYPADFDNLVSLEPSFTRIFHYKEIGKLQNEDVKKFFINSYAKVNMTYDKEALDLLTEYSSGLPILMQHIGDHAFWLAEDNHITKEIAIDAIIYTGHEIGDKVLINMLRKITSDSYIEILTKIAENGLFQFNKKEVYEILDKDDKRVFDNCLTHMIESNIIDSYDSENVDLYEFSNRIYYAYFLIRSLELNQNQN